MICQRENALEKVFWKKFSEESLESEGSICAIVSFYKCFRPATRQAHNFLKTDSEPVVFRWILRKFEKYSWYRTLLKTSERMLTSWTNCKILSCNYTKNSFNRVLWKFSLMKFSCSKSTCNHFVFFLKIISDEVICSKVEKIDLHFLYLYLLFSGDTTMTFLKRPWNCMNYYFSFRKYE